MELKCQGGINLESLVKLKEQIEKYQCYNEQEEKDKEEILRHLCESAHILKKDNEEYSFHVGMDRK